MRNPWNTIRNLFSLPRELAELRRQVADLHRKTENVLALCAQSLEKVESDSAQLLEHEFRVYSQWGEDGILSYLIDIIEPSERAFVEFGVENYKEANTRWLLQNRNWRGLVIDGSEENVRQIINDDIYWRHQLTAVASFITRENINELLATNGFSGPLGILSIDIDGVDYWIWQAVECVSPCIVVVEYNSLFGDSACVTVPYSPDFQRSKAHYSLSYYGASLSAFERLGKEKGYALVGSNSAGNNAFFVRDDLMRAPLKRLSAKEAYIRRGFREARDQFGNLTMPLFDAEQQVVLQLPLVDCSKQIANNNE